MSLIQLFAVPAVFVPAESSAQSYSSLYRETFRDTVLFVDSEST
jgi:hypothetical protein